MGAPKFRDYTVGGPESALAIKKGLASGKWFLPFVERTVMRRLMKRDDYHATRDTAFLLAILLTTFSTSYYCWQTGRYGLFALFFWLHCTFYTSCGDSRYFCLNVMHFGDTMSHFYLGVRCHVRKVARVRTWHGL